MKKTEPLTIAALSRLTGSQRKDISRWLSDEGLTPADGKGRCVACIRDHQEKPTAKDTANPKTGLTFRQELHREQAKALKRDNDAAEARMAREWVTTKRHNEVIDGLCDKMATAPDRIKIQLGLTDEQTAALRKVFADIDAEFRQVTTHATKLFPAPPANAAGATSDSDSPGVQSSG